MKRFIRTTLVLLGATLLYLPAMAGGDHFKVLLNGKVLIQQAMYDKFNLKQLDLSQANAGDVLTFHYSHCGRVGTGRKIAFRDAKGNVVKEWAFADAKLPTDAYGNVKGAEAGMDIPVKDILALRQQDLQVAYTAKELPKGQLMAAFHIVRSTTSEVLSKAFRPLFAALLPSARPFA
ncbi:hypothetical protein ACWKWU_11485 [Chitinophaga lutea]